MDSLVHRLFIEYQYRDLLRRIPPPPVGGIYIPIPINAFPISIKWALVVAERVCFLLNACFVACASFLSLVRRRISLLASGLVYLDALYFTGGTLDSRLLLHLSCRFELRADRFFRRSVDLVSILTVLISRLVLGWG